MLNVLEIRLINTRHLAKSLAGSEDPKGISKLAERVGKSQSQISHYIGKTPIKGIGNKVARDIERAFPELPPNWLDHPHDDVVAGVENPEWISSRIPVIPSKPVNLSDFRIFSGSTGSLQMQSYQLHLEYWRRQGVTLDASRPHTADHRLQKY